MRLESARKEALFFLIAIFMAFLTLKGFLGSGYPPSWGGDAYGHLFKIWKLMGGYRPWIEDWYGGYPFLRFYPPLAYYLGALLGVLTHSAIWGYKLSALLSLIIGALSMRFLLRELGFSDLPSYLASLAYAFAPYHLRILSPEGNFPRFVAINLAPLLVLGFIYIFRGDRRKALTAGVLISLVLLTHHTLAVSFGLVLLFLLPYLRETKREWRTPIQNLFIAGIVAFLISAFWVLPFILEKGNAHFLKENAIDYLFKFQSARLGEILLSTGPWSFYQGTLMYLGIFGALMTIKRKKTLSIAVLAGVFTSLLLSLGYYGPTPWLNRLPILDLIPPYRWLGTVEFLAAIGFAMLLEFVLNYAPKIHPDKFRKVALIISLVLLLLSLSDLRFRVDSLNPEEFPGNYMGVLNYIGNDNGTGWRYYQWGLEITQGSRVAFTPALTKKPALDGWYRQGDPAYPGHSYLNYAVLNDLNFARKALRAYSVKYILLDSSFKDTPRVEENLKSIGFREIYSVGNFKLYSWDNHSLLTPEAGVLVVGNWPLDTGVEYERGKFVDDHADSLGRYSLVILNNYVYRDPFVWRKLEDYVRDGGILVVNTFGSPDAEATRFGVRSTIVKVFGKANLSSGVYNVSRFSNFTYEGKPWTATAYTGNLTPLIRMGNLTVLGVKEYGKGRIYFVGLNLPYHAVYARNDYEARLLNEILSRYIAPAKIEYRIVKVSDGEIVMKYTADRSTAVILSENYYPHWRAYVDGKGIKISRNEQFGLIELQLPAGEHEVELKFEDPYSPLGYLSLISLVAVLGFLAWDRVRRKG